MKSKDDKILIQKIKESDFNAFHDLYYKYQPILYNQILYMTKDQDLTKDLIQETFYRVWIKRKSLKPQSSLYGYLNRICINLLYDHFKHKKIKHTHQVLSTRLEKSNHNHIEERLDIILLKEEVRKIINKYLPPKCRMIFILSRIDGKSNDEIASLLKISRRTVEHQLFRALQIIRKKLSNFL